MTFKFKIPFQLQPGLTSRGQTGSRYCASHLIRFCALTASLMSAGCSAYLETTQTLGQGFERPSKKIPAVDLTNASWQKFSPDQPSSNPLRVAVITRDDKIGLTRVVVKSPPNFSLPPHWFTVEGNYTVLKGAFVFDGIDTKGKPNKFTQRPGDFASIPANFILRPASQGAGEALLYVTVYGDWSPKFPGGAWGKALAEPVVTQLDNKVEQPVEKPVIKPTRKPASKQVTRREVKPPEQPLLRGAN